ncbi:MAG TPA: hypothetical protein VEG84_01290 [Thermoanaerobaculia bacterium]|nr:hypothetical protein [Thermoanaerobaculia bacterium]
MKETVEKLESELVSRYGESERPRVRRGLAQAGEFWRPSDGDAAAFAETARSEFAGDAATREALFSRMEFALESYDGHINEISRDFRRQSDLDLGAIYPFDEILAAYDPGSHFVDDAFQNRLAFAVLLNFPVTSLADRLREGESWTRRQWAEARLADRFSKRIPSAVNQAISQAAAHSAQYIAQYNIWMHHLVDPKGNRLFPEKLRLLSHWNLRDELKANYGDARAGLARQRQIAHVMERIVTQTIPEAVIDNPGVDWDPVSNAVHPSAVKDSSQEQVKSLPASSAAEPDTRYAMLLKCFQASRQADPYSPTAPTLIARRFDENRQIPEERVRRMLEAVLTSPLVPRVARLIERRLGRKLEPFDIWYAGFKPRGGRSEEELDRITRARYPTAEAYKNDIPNLLQGLGFSKEKALYLAGHIEVDPARGSGHALAANRRADHAHLRTRVEKDGMNYKGFNIALHEMGHNVEQTFSLNDVDSTLLQGVPNTAFTEALAFVFQGHDLELLGLAKPDAESAALRTLNDFWAAYEISGVALVDMAVWHWMYDHPEASAAELKRATLDICRDLWNRYDAPVIGRRDSVLLGTYSHMIDSFLYLPDYPIGHLIAFQIEQQVEKTGAIGPEFERMARIGNVAPDIWMKQATGAPVGPDALLQAAEHALAAVH